MKLFSTLAKSFFVTCVVFSLSFARSASAADLDYPELMVTPRASERIQMEAQHESGSEWRRFFPYQLSALTTLIAGATFEEEDKDPFNPNQRKSYANIVGIGVGGGWLVATLAFSAFYSPYDSAARALKAMPRGSSRETLIRERMAEEALEEAASFGRKLTWFSVGSNFLASAYMLGKNERSNYTGTVMAGASLAASFTPLLFKTRWQRIANDQREYKKKIYGPIADAWIQPAAMSEPLTGKIAPCLMLSLQF